MGTKPPHAVFAVPVDPVSPEPLETVATACQRLSVLLAAGLSPALAWTELAATQTVASRLPHRRISPAIIRQVADGYRRGVSADETLISLTSLLLRAGAAGWSPVAAVWRIAARSGAPIADALSELSEQLRAAADVRREIRTVLAAIRASSRLMMLLPLLGFVIACGLGIDVASAVAESRFAQAGLVIACVLLWLGHRWTQSMVRRCVPPRVCSGLTCQLIVLGLTAGWSIQRCRDETMQLALWRGVEPADWAVIEPVLHLAERSGAPVVPLLLAEQRGLQVSAHVAAKERVGVLSVRALIPLGLCVLPAFVLSTVVPVILSLVSNTLSALP